jgi:hypothetical protein
MAESFTTQRARLGALAQHAQHNPRKTTAAGREAFLGGFRRDVIAAAEVKGEILDETEIERRAGYLRKAYFVRLALKSAKARRARKAGTS